MLFRPRESCSARDETELQRRELKFSDLLEPLGHLDGRGPRFQPFEMTKLLTQALFDVAGDHRSLMRLQEPKEIHASQHGSFKIPARHLCQHPTAELLPPPV